MLPVSAAAAAGAGICDAAGHETGMGEGAPLLEPIVLPLPCKCDGLGGNLSPGGFIGVGGDVPGAILNTDPDEMARAWLAAATAVAPLGGAPEVALSCRCNEEACRCSASVDGVHLVAAVCAAAACCSNLCLMDATPPPFETD